MFTHNITLEQIEYAKNLALHSMIHHSVGNIWDNGSEEKFDGKNWTEDNKKMFRNRFVGTVGETIFSDYHNIERPSRSYGAVDGQDKGKDYHFIIGAKKESREMVLDLKTMRRNSANVQKHYVLNIPEHQLDKSDSETGHYYVLSLVLPEDATKTFLFEEENVFIKNNIPIMKIIFIGYLDKKTLHEKVKFNKKGDVSMRDDGNKMTHYYSSYEIPFSNFKKPWTVSRNY